MSNYKYAIESSKKRLKENPIVELINEQALWVQKQQIDFTYSLDYDSFIIKKDEKREYAKRFEKLSEYEAPYEFQWLPEAGNNETINKDIIEKRERSIEAIKGDIYISEAVNILIDLSSSIKTDDTIAQNKKG